MFQSINFKNPPVLCGLNRFFPKKGSLTVLAARKISVRGGRTDSPSPWKGESWGGGQEYPLLVIDPYRRVAALATDLAPHWAGGLVDWGKRRLRLPVRRKISVEVGARYVAFVSSLLRWLAEGQKDTSE